MARDDGTQDEQDAKSVGGSALDVGDIEDVGIDERVEAVDLPVRPDALVDPTGGTSLPGNEEPDPGDQTKLSDDVDLDGPSSGYSDIDPAELGFDNVSVLDEQLEQLLESDPGYGGLDGRNPGSDTASSTRLTDDHDISGSADPIGGNPHFGAGFQDGSAAGLSYGELDILKGLNQAAQEAAAAEDFEAVDKIADETHAFLVEIGEAEPVETPGEAPNAGEDDIEVVTSGGTPVGYSETDGVVAGETSKEIAEKHEGDVFSGGAKVYSGTHAPVKTDGGPPEMKLTPKGEMLKAAEDQIVKDSTPKSKPEAEDRAEEHHGPDLHADFTDAYLEHKTEAEGGADIDNNPNADPHGGSVDDISDDPDPFTAEYDDGYLAPSEEQLQGAIENYDPTPYEEFHDI